MLGLLTIFGIILGIIWVSAIAFFPIPILLKTCAGLFWVWIIGYYVVNRK